MSNAIGKFFKARREDPIGEYFKSPNTVREKTVYRIIDGMDISILVADFMRLPFNEQELAILMHEPVECKDGFMMSVQAGWGNYCTPKKNVYSLEECHYTKFEVGYPNRKEPYLKDFQDKKGDMTDSIYPYVPKGLINNIIIKHGGLKNL